MLSGLSPLQDGYRFATNSQSDFFHWTFNKLTTAKSEMIEGNFSCYLAGHGGGRSAILVWLVRKERLDSDGAATLRLPSTTD